MLFAVPVVTVGTAAWALAVIKSDAAIAAMKVRMCTETRDQAPGCGKLVRIERSHTESGMKRRSPIMTRALAVTGMRERGRLIAFSIALATASGPAPSRAS